MFEAKAREYFQSAFDHLIKPATEEPETVWLVLGMKLLTTYILSEVGSEHKVCFGASLRLTKGFGVVKKIN